MTKDTSKDQIGAQQGQDAVSSADDDDIVDLLNVVTSGKTPPASTVATPAAMKETIDSILAGNDQEEQNTKPEAFPDPTPVTHQVDPDEKLDLPGLDDIDSLLKTLEASSAAKSPDHAGNVKPESQPGDSAKSLAEPMEEDGADTLQDKPIPASPNGTAEKTSAQQENEHSEANVPLDNPDDFTPIKPVMGITPAEQNSPEEQNSAISMAENGANSSVVTPENMSAASGAETNANAPAEGTEMPSHHPLQNSESAPSGDISSEKLEGFPTASEQIVAEPSQPQVTSEPVHPAEANSAEDLDVKELDALLDDMLATAPASGLPPQPGKPSMERNATEEQLSALAEKVSMLISNTVPALEKQLTMVGSQVAGLSEQSSPPQPHIDLKPLQDGLAGATTSLGQLRDELTVVSDQCKTLDASIAEQQKSISSLQARMDEINDNLERVVARAAAKVLREEIEALTQTEE